MVAVALLGCAVGAWFAGQLADRWGRRKVMLLAAGLFFVSSVGSGFAFGAGDLMVWRVVGGLGVGIASVIAPSYIGEIAPAKWRGGLGSLQQLAITLGILLALISDALLANTAGGAIEDLWWGIPAWRWMLLAEVVPAVVYGGLSLTIPESPQFLVRKGQDAPAREVLRGYSGTADPDQRIAAIRESIASEKPASYGDLRGSAMGLQPILWVGMTVAALQQLVGINVIFYYSATLWQSVGFSENESLTTSVITAVLNLVMTFVAILFVDKVGRRRLLLSGSVGMVVGLGAMSVAFSQATGSGDAVALGAPWGTIGRQCEPFRGLLRGDVGPGHVGRAGRDLPQPDPGPRAGHQHRRELDLQLRRDPALPGAERRGGAGPRLRGLRRARAAVLLVRQGEDAGRDRAPARGQEQARPNLASGPGRTGPEHDGGEWWM